MTTVPNDGFDPKLEAGPPSSLANKLYLAVWRWHFYSGLYVIPFTIMLALTGLVILFQPQLEALQYRDRLFVTPPATTATLENPLDLAQPYTAQLEAVKKAYPDAELGSFTPPTAANRSAQVLVTPKDAPQRTAFVDPYTATVLGDVQNNARWGSVAENIHGTLLIGKTGDRLIEIAAGLGVILLVSGLYLWWPRGGNGLYGVLIPRFNAGRRTMWRDLHAVPGFWIGGALIAFLITGLSWTGVWGEQFTQAWNTFPAALWNDVPKSDATHASLNADQKRIPWNLEQTPLPASGSWAGKDGIPAGTPVNLDSVIAFARGNGFSQSFTVNAPSDKEGVWTVAASSMSRQVDDARKDLTMHLDQYTGKVLATVGWKDYSLSAQGMAAGIALHMGGMGTWNVVLNTVFCLSVLLISVSGVVMWWLRRPVGAWRLGAPPMPKNLPLWKGAVVIVVALGVAFPLAGLTMLAAVILDVLVFSRIKPLKTLFG
jgi:uncharacterized iron-regulated membrane protein